MKLRGSFIKFKIIIIFVHTLEFKFLPNLFSIIYRKGNFIANLTLKFKINFKII